jgi:hypothetical protein
MYQIANMKLCVPFIERVSIADKLRKHSKEISFLTGLVSWQCFVDFLSFSWQIFRVGHGPFLPRPLKQLTCILLNFSVIEPNLSQRSPGQMFTTYLFNIYFNITLSSIRKPPKWCLLFRYSNWNCLCIYCLSYACHVPRHLVYFDVITIMRVLLDEGSNYEALIKFAASSVICNLVQNFIFIFTSICVLPSSWEIEFYTHISELNYRSVEGYFMNGRQ